MAILALAPGVAMAETPPIQLEQAVSETLDIWREGRYEQLYERLSHRSRVSREQFVKTMREVNVRPACCWQKLENFRVLREKRNEATVFARVGLEGPPDRASASSSREFKLYFESGTWKMQLNDIYHLSGISGRRGRR
jgi:hypothetical protein